MTISKLRNIIISDDDIEWVESLMGNGIHFNTAQRDAIKNLESVDIQAFPGSGKTTTLVAKLAILAKKWPFTHSGICVLSHTNVARNEIETRLGNTPEGAKLLSYPHFIGTLHSFFDTYITLPWIRSKGVQLNIIDTDYVRALRWNNLSQGTQSYFSRNHKDDNICGYVTDWGNIEWDKGGQTRTELLEIINQSQKAGCFTYDEMLLLAKKVLTNHPDIVEGIEERFPIVFIDEAQDTNSLLWELIVKAFPYSGKNSIRQGFGDSNQAIYNYFNESVEEPDFPRPSCLVLSESKRFDERIASLTNSVALSAEPMHGTPNEYTERNVPHTIFLFNKDTIQNVIDEFAELILASFSDEELLKNSNLGCHVIGMVHNKKEETSNKQFPKGIYDYWPSYVPNGEIKNEPLYKFIDYYRRGKREYAQSRKYVDLIGWLAKGIRRIINNAANKNFIPASGNPLMSIEKLLCIRDKQTFRSILYELSNTNITEKEQWDCVIPTVQRILSLFDLSSNKNVDSFLKWTDPELDNEEDEKGKKPNTSPSNHYVYVDAQNGRSVDLEFGSIHSVKGCTHFATLVLETFSRAHNIKSILRYICGNPPPKERSNANVSRLKCQYVAMSRSKALLCMAIPAEFVDEEERKQLIQAGWIVKDI